MIEEGVEIYRENGCDFIIGLGGGSPLDAAKGIAAMTVLEGSIADYKGVRIDDAELPPLVCIPTTAGSGSEVTKYTIITNEANGASCLLVIRYCPRWRCSTTHSQTDVLRLLQPQQALTH